MAASPTGHTVTLVPGDGIGPEVVNAARRIVDATGVRIDWEEAMAGGEAFRAGIVSGVPDETIESISRTRLVLKGPLETPVGYGEKSANVTLRKLFETFANLRPVREFPGVPTPYQGRGIDLVVVRENVEDLYAGIEHQQTPGVAQCLKLMSRKGCEKIAVVALELARAEGRSSVHCATKANIMKLTEGLLKRTFEEVAERYPELRAEHIIVDNCAHQLVRRPEQFEIIVTSNMNGDILSDLTSGLVGGLGFAPSANIGTDIAIFEAVHGSAPKYTGRDVINPSALVLSAAMLLRHLHELDAADDVEHAVARALEDGIATRDVLGDGGGAVGTREFTEAVIARLGQRCSRLEARTRKPLRLPDLRFPVDLVRPASRREVGVDVFIEAGGDVEQLAASLGRHAAGTPLRLKMISNRGTQVWPATGGQIDCVDHWRCRFVLDEQSGEGEVPHGAVIDLLAAIGSEHRWMHVERLSEFDGEPGYTRAQGER
jgi:isocitrate dehydrogenase